VISNLTDPVTDDKALEGTVHRILLKLQTGQNERYTDVKFSMSLVRLEVYKLDFKQYVQVCGRVRYLYFLSGRQSC
jgi:hypothetical protein